MRIFPSDTVSGRAKGAAGGSLFVEPRTISATRADTGFFELYPNENARGEAYGNYRSGIIPNHLKRHLVGLSSVVENRAGVESIFAEQP